MRLLILLLFISLQINVLAQDKLKVVSSASIFADMAENIGKDRIEIKSIVPIGGDPHLHEPIPRDAQIVAEAEVILINGLTFEGWITELIDNSGTSASVFTITENIEPITSLVYKDSSDPHAWMSAKNGLTYIDNIEAALSKTDPANADFYKQNAKAYRMEVSKLHQYILKETKTIPRENRVLITSHDAFQYYGRTYSLNLEAIMGISTEAEAQTADMIRVNDAISKYNVPAIFIESTINPAMIKQIAKDNNIMIGGELFADSLGDKDSKASTYIKMLKNNTDVIVKALRDKIKADHNKHTSEKSEGGLLTYLIIGTLLLAGMGFVIYKMNNN